MTAIQKRYKPFKIEDVRLDVVNDRECVVAKLKTEKGECDILEFINRNIVGLEKVNRQKHNNLSTEYRDKVKELFDAIMFFDCPVDEIFDALDEEIRRIVLPF